LCVRVLQAFVCRRPAGVARTWRAQASRVAVSGERGGCHAGARRRGDGDGWRPHPQPVSWWLEFSGGRGAGLAGRRPVQTAVRGGRRDGHTGWGERRARPPPFLGGGAVVGWLTRGRTGGPGRWVTAAGAAGETPGRASNGLNSAERDRPPSKEGDSDPRFLANCRKVGSPGRCGRRSEGAHGHRGNSVGRNPI